MFPLFRLPMVALKEVFRRMAIEELFLVSLLSNKGKQAIRASIPKGCLPISCSFKEELEVSVGSCRFVVPSLWAPGHMNPFYIYKIGNVDFGLISDDDYCFIAPENHLNRYNSMIMIIHLLGEVFNSMVSISCSNPTTAVKLLRYFKERKTEIRKLEIHSVLTTSEYKEILDSCSAIDVLDVNAGPIANFQYSPLRPFTTKSVTLRGSWMKLEDFLHCERLQILEDHYSRWTPGRLNTFLKTWIITDCKLENFSLCLKDPESFPSVVEGLTDKHIQDEPTIEVQKKDGRRFKIFHEEFFLTVEPIREEFN